MATTYNTAFGSLPGYNEMLGTTNTTGGGQQQVYGQRAQQQRQQQQQPAPAQTFAQMQQRGFARPAPPSAPQAQPFAQYGGSQQAQQMRQRLQSQLEQFGQAPSRFDTQAFQQIRGAQAANLQQEYRGQLQALNEELARRGLSASSVGGGRMGDLAGQQARALASLDAQLLQQAAETQAQDRAQLLAASQGLAELASAQDLAQFEANRVAQAATFENQLRAAQFGQQQFEQAGQEAFQGAQAEEAAQQAARAFDLQATGQAAGLSMDLQRLLGQQELERAQLTGQLGGAQTLAAQQQAEQRRQFDIQQLLQAQLGLGGLSLEQQRFAEQARQFGVTSGEQQRQFDIQQALQQTLGLGGLGLQQAQLGLEQQRFLQQAQDTAAERELRQILQTRELTAQERQQLTDIQSRRELQTQQLGVQQAESAAERDIRLRLQAGQITAEQAQQERALAVQQALQTQQLGVQQAESAAERDIRVRLQSGQITAEQAQQERQIAAQQALQTQQLTEQARQFGITSGEQQRQFDLEQTLRQQLGLGGLDIQRGQLGIEQQRLQQQTTDAAAERQLRETLQTRELSAQERQQLTEIQARKDLQTQQIGEQARQFGLTLDDQQAARVYQGGFTTQELAIRRQQVDNELALQNRQLSETERNNLAINGLEQQKVADDRSFRAQQLGLNGRELDLRATQIQQEFQQRGQQITNDQAYRQAELDLRSRQLVQEGALQGRQIDVDAARTQAQRDISAADNTAQMARLNAQLTSQERVATADREIQRVQSLYQQAAQISEQSGIQHGVVNGEVVPLRGGDGAPLRTSATTQAEEARKQQGDLTRLELQLREQLGMTEAAGQLFTRDAQGRLTAGAETLASQLRRAEVTGRLGGEETLQRTQLEVQRTQQLYQQAAQLSEQSGVQHGVVGGQVTPLRDANGQMLRTSAFTQAEQARQQQFSIATLEADLRRQLGLTEATGQLYTIGAGGQLVAGGETLASQLQRAQATGFLGGQETLQRQQLNTQQTMQLYQQAAQISEQSGIQHGVANGQVFPLRDGSGNFLQTSAVSQSNLERDLRRQLGMSEATGFVYEPWGRTGERTVQGNLATNQMFMQLASVLSGLTGAQLEQLRGGTYNPPTAPAVGTITSDGAWRWNGSAWVANTGTRA